MALGCLLSESKKYILIVVALLLALPLCVLGYFYFSHSKQIVAAGHDNPYVSQILMAEKEAINTFERTNYVGMSEENGFGMIFNTTFKEL